MSFAPLPLLPAHLTRQDSRTLTTAGGRRRGPRSAASTDNKVWRVVTTEEGEPEHDEDGPSTAIQRGNGVQISLEKLLKPPGAPSSKPPSQWKASPPTGLTLEELQRRASGQHEHDRGEEHTFRQGKSSPPRTPARGRVVFAPHVKIASGPPRAHALATTPVASSAEAESVAHDFVTVAPSTRSSSKQPPPSSKAKPSSCRPTSATGRLRHVASKLRPSTAPDGPGHDIASSASPSLNHAQPKEAKSRPKTDPNSPPQHGNATQSQSRPAVTYCPASEKEPGFPDGYIVGRLHPDGPFSSSGGSFSGTASKQGPSTSPAAAATAASFQGLAAEEPTIFRPARPQELPRVQGRFYEGTLILVRGKEDEAADAEGAPQPKQEEVTEDGAQKGSASASKVGFAGRVKQTVGRIKSMGDATDTSAEAQQPPTPQRRVGPAAAAAKGKAAARVNLPSKPRARQEGQRQLRRRASTGAAPSKRKATPPAPPPIPTRSSSAELARDAAAAAAAAEPAEPSSTTTASSLKGGSMTGDPAPRGDTGVKSRNDQDAVTPDNELATLPIILWSGWASCSSSASSGCSTPSSSSCSSTLSQVAPRAPPSPSRRSAFDQSRGQQQHQQSAAGKAMGKGGVSRNAGRGAQEGKAAAALPGSSAMLPMLGGAVRLAVKKVANARRPVTPAPAALVPPPPPLLGSAAEKRGGEATELEDSSGRAALDLPARDCIPAVEDSTPHKLVTPKASLARASREPAYRKHAQQQHRREVRIVVWPRSTSQAGLRSKSRTSLGASDQQGKEFKLEEHGEGDELDSRLAEEEDGEVAKSNGAVVLGGELRSILL